MLTVVCGEDSILAFDHYLNLKKDFQKQGYEIVEINPDELEKIPLWLGESQMLFYKKKVFFTKNLNKKLSKKLNLKINKVVENLINDKTVEIIDFEEGLMSWALKFPQKTIIKEFKLKETIFKLQESLYPGNLKNFLTILDNLSKEVDENFIFIMLARHIKNLILIKTNTYDTKLQKWQIYKLKTQAASWPTEKLINFYDTLYKIDLSQKTSSTPLSLKKSLDILSCYYL